MAGTQQINMKQLYEDIEKTGNERPFALSRFKAGLKALEQLRAGKNTTIKDVTGAEVEVKAESFRHTNEEELSLRYSPYQKTADKTPSRYPNWYSEADKMSAANHIGATCPLYVRVESNGLLEKSEETYGKKFPDYKKAWKESPQYKQLLHAVEGWKSTKRADKMVCFGLGTLDEKGESYGISYTQHLAAFTLAHALGITDIHLQDPMYIPEDQEALRNTAQSFHPNLKPHFLDDPQGFLALDSKTFIVSISPDIPVHQIVADLAVDFGQPAGMLWDRVTDDGDYTEYTSAGDKPYTSGSSSKYVWEMVKKSYDEKMFDDNPVSKDDVVELCDSRKFPNTAIYLRKE